MGRKKIVTSDPIPPAAAPHKSKGIRSVPQFCLQTAFSMASVTARVRPMTNPPARDATVPRVDKPPLVPGGTDLSVVIKMGGDLDNIPSSDARVSPKQQEKWLDAVHQPFVQRCEPCTHPREARSRALLNPDVTCGDMGHHSADEYD